jgi:hypothetical protein
MQKILSMITALAIAFPVIATTPVTLSGVIKENLGGNPIKGVTVTLAKIPSLFAVTDSDGKFVLSSSATTPVVASQTRKAELLFDGVSLVFNGHTSVDNGSVAVFSCNGREIASAKFTAIEPGKSLLSVPDAGDGIIIIRVTLDGNVQNYQGIRMGSGFYLNSNAKNGIASGSIRSKTATAGQIIDTVIARKPGYIESIYFIGSYSMSDVDLVMIPTGNPDSHYPIPQEADLADISHPDQVIGNGTPESCTPAAFINAVAKGGVIVFNCGRKPTTLVLDKPAKIVNDAKQDVVIDGGGLVTLSGGGKTRILYMNTCDSNQHWTTSHCQNQESPRLTVQNLTFVNGNSKKETEYDGGGAIWVRGGRFKIVNCAFYNNICADSGPDVGGAAVRVFSQYENKPVYVVNSRFGGSAQELGNVGANGGGLSSIGVSWTVIRCLFSYNQAIGRGGNPAESGTPGGGSGGAIYNDGNTMTLSILGTLIEHNSVKAYGSAIFFVSNDHTGNIVIDSSTIRNNTGGSWYAKPGISMHDDTKIAVTNSSLQ